MELEVDKSDLVEMVRQALGQESLRAVIKQDKAHTFHAVDDHLQLKISVEYDLKIHAFERDHLKTLELSMSPALLARIIVAYGEILQREGSRFPHKLLVDALIRAHTAVIKAKTKSADRLAHS